MTYTTPTLSGYVGDTGIYNSSPYLTTTNTYNYNLGSDTGIVGDIYGNSVAPTTTSSAVATPTQTPLALAPTAVVVRNNPSPSSSTGSSVDTGTSKVKETAGQVAHNWSQMGLGEKANVMMGTVGSLLNAYNSYRANKLAKEQFAHAKQTAERNWDAQRKMTNSQLEDRQIRRVEEAKANGRTTRSVGEYMKQYGI